MNTAQPMQSRMKLMRAVRTCCFVFFLCSSISHSQAPHTDSLLALLRNAHSDTARLRYLVEIGEVCNVVDNLKYGSRVIALADSLLAGTSDQQARRKYLKSKTKAYSWFAYYYETKGDTSKQLDSYRKSMSIFRAIQDTAHIIDTYIQMALIYAQSGNFPVALDLLDNGLAESKKMNYKPGIAAVLFRLGEQYANQGDKKQALANFQKSITIYTEIKDTVKLAYTYVIMGNIIGKRKKMSEALDCYNRSLKLYATIKDDDNVLWVYNCMGNIYVVNDDTDSALFYYDKSLAIAQGRSNTYWVAVLLDNIGNLYLKKNEPGKALDYHTRALRINRMLHDDSRKAWSFDCLARTYFAQQNFRMAGLYNDSAMDIWTSRALDESLIGGYQLAASIDSALGNGMAAYEHYKEYIILRDKYNSMEVQRAATKAKFQDEYDARKAAEKIEQDKRDAKAAEERRRQLLVTWSVIAGSCLVIIFSAFILRSLRITRKQKKTIEIQKEEVELAKMIIEEKNKGMTDSIHYASRIQQSLLPNERYIERCLKRLHDN